MERGITETIRRLDANSEWFGDKPKKMCGDLAETRGNLVEMTSNLAQRASSRKY